MSDIGSKSKRLVPLSINLFVGISQSGKIAGQANKLLFFQNSSFIVEWHQGALTHIMGPRCCLAALPEEITNKIDNDC
jgi:hypothetical protein